MSNLTVTDWPVARADHPLTSTLAGENQAAREASENAVLDLLSFTGDDHAMSSHDVVCLAQLAGYPWTEQRLRTALAQLSRKGLVERAGRKEGASPTGRAAMTYRLATR